MHHTPCTNLGSLISTFTKLTQGNQVIGVAVSTKGIEGECQLQNLYKYANLA